jgi:endonuclease/exonuclease/phosphatase family metal-dependent hydrolase
MMSKNKTHSGVALLLRKLVWLALLGCAAAAAAENGAALPATAADPAAPQVATSSVADSRLRLLSWNVSNDAFVRDPDVFRALMRKARPDVLLLDEVSPSTSEDQLREALDGPEAGGAAHWHINTGRSGGRQRNVIASRLPLEPLPEFGKRIAYPRLDRERIARRMRAANSVSSAANLEDGIAVNGAIVQAGARRLLVVSLDLQCCGNDPGSWEEERRSVETREIRRRVQQVLRRVHVDGVILAGDFNLVASPLPLLIAAGPYPAPHAGLLAAELYQIDSHDTWTWTWDGHGERFPDRAMDFMLYSPRSLTLDEGYILDTEDLSPGELASLGLEHDSVDRLSDHRPLVAQFQWQ